MGIFASPVPTPAYISEQQKAELVADVLEQVESGPVDISSTWIFLATNWSSAPAFVETISGGDVFSYTLNGTTRYRFVPSPYDSDNDAFYSGFSTPTLSGLIVKRG